MFQRIHQHFQAQCVLVPQEYGFRKGLSTDNISYKLTHSTFTAWNKKIYVPGLRCSCRGLFKKLDILSVSCEYVFSLMMFTVSSLNHFQINSVMQRANTGANTSCIDPP